MKKVILSSHGFEKNKELLSGILDLLSKKVDDSSVVIITTASIEWKERNKHAVLAKETFENAGFQKVVFLDVECEDPAILNNFDVIYINGGNPFYLLHHLKQSGADRIISHLLETDVVLVGVSGGGVVLGPDISIVEYFDSKLNTVGLSDLSGLGIVDDIMYPHYKVELEEEIRGFERKRGHKVLCLHDDQMKVFES